MLRMEHGLQRHVVLYSEVIMVSEGGIYIKSQRVQDIPLERLIKIGWTVIS